MKVFLKKLRRLLQFNGLCGNFHFITLGIVLFLIMILRFSWLMLVVCILYLLILFIRSLKHLVLVMIILSIMLVNLFLRGVNYNKINYGDIYIQGTVVSVKEKENSNQIIIKDDNLKYIFYDESKLIRTGDLVNVWGTLVKTEKNHIPLLFNYQRYLKENNIKGIITDITYQKVKKTISIYSLHQKILNYFNLQFKGKTLAFLKALLIGDKTSLGDKLSDEISRVGIGHLFVISGLHMNVLQKIVEKLLKLFRVPKASHTIIIIAFFFLYFLITLYLISILRVLLVFLISSINKKTKLNLTTLDIYALAILLILIVNPYYIMNYSFILTFIISTSLVIINPLLKYKKFKGLILNNILMSVNSILVTIPIIAFINPSINILSIIYNLFYIPFVSYLLLPFSLVVTVFKFLSPIYEGIVGLFSKVTSFLSTIKIGELRLSTNYQIFPIIFYVIVLIIIVYFLGHYSLRKKVTSIVALAITTIIWSNSAYLNQVDQLYFLDLPEGDSTLIIKSFNRANILIDTGEDVNNDLDTFLKKKGIKTLDFVFISHGDSDHNGRLYALIENFKIKNIVISQFDNSTKAICRNYNYQGNIITVCKGSIVRYKDIIFDVLSPSIKGKNTNNDSVVMKVEAYGKTILMTGDMEKEIENALIKEYKKIDVDIYKIPHHGSLTSSTKAFINNLEYNYAVCMSGYRNTFGFPNNNVIGRYERSKLLLTKENNTILFKKKWYQKNLKLDSQS